MQRLGAAQDGGQRLERGADDVVLRLLRGESGAAGLGVEAKHHRARVLGAEALLSDASPHAACGAELRHLLQEVGVGGEEERQPRREVVELQPCVQRRLHIGDGVGEGERHLLHSRAAGLAHVVAAYADRVPLR